jgi:putative transcriptional regulator
MVGQALTGDGGMKAHAPTELIAEYAAGALAPGMRLLVASHVAWCPACRGKVARLEAIGGALLAEGEEVAPEPRCLVRTLARIARPVRRDRLAVFGAEPVPLPDPLRLHLAMPVCDLRWRPLLPGLCECRLGGFPTEAVGLVRAEPGARMLAPGHCGRESRLVLAGRFQDGARTYARGDLALPGPRGERCPEAVGGDPCLCLVVQPDLGVPTVHPVN